MKIIIFLGDAKGEAAALANSIGQWLYQIAKGNSGQESLDISRIKDFLDESLHNVFEDIREILVPR
jgi:hypothetical protein